MIQFVSHLWNVAEKYLPKHSLISLFNNNQGRIQGGGAHPARAPPLKLEKIWFFWGKIVIFHTKYPKKFSHLPPLGAIFLSAPPLTWNPGSAPIDLNMYIINVIADDESKIGLYEIYFLND